MYKTLKCIIYKLDIVFKCSPKNLWIGPEKLGKKWEDKKRGAHKTRSDFWPRFFSPCDKDCRQLTAVTADRMSSECATSDLCDAPAETPYSHFLFTQFLRHFNQSFTHVQWCFQTLSTKSHRFAVNSPRGVMHYAVISSCYYLID